MKPLTVLIVEDEPLVRMDMADVLARAGFEVLEAANAAEAVSVLEEHSDIDILFTDVDMPGSMDGLMLAAAVRKRWPPVRIIVTSGHHKVAPEEMPGDSRFFGKPYHAEAVTAAMREMVE
ncbi:MAG: response regulator [Verrucomicrobiaceae bacterium]|nr:MAG: response regulator [Verrucomicrobiaceae bacterium]